MHINFADEFLSLENATMVKEETTDCWDDGGSAVGRWGLFRQLFKPLVLVSRVCNRASEPKWDIFRDVLGLIVNWFLFQYDSEINWNVNLCVWWRWYTAANREGQTRI